MSKYYLKLGDMVIPRISSIVVSPFYRAETRQTTLSGGLAVDRGDMKKQIEVAVRIMSAEEFAALENIITTIVVPAEFYYLNKLVTINAVAEPIQSKDEVYLYGKRENGVYYVNIKFKLEEQ